MLVNKLVVFIVVEEMTVSIIRVVPVVVVVVVAHVVQCIANRRGETTFWKTPRETNVLHIFTKKEGVRLNFPNRNSRYLVHTVLPPHCSELMKHTNMQIFPMDDLSDSSTAQHRFTTPPCHSSRTDRELDLITGLSERRRVSLPLAKVASILIDATKQNRAWMEDFKEDLVEMDSDLYEILMAHKNLPTRKAA